MTRKHVIALIVIIVAVLLVRAMFTSHSSSSSSYSTTTSQTTTDPATSTTTSDGQTTAAPAPAVPASGPSDPNNLLIGSWTSTNGVAADRPGTCSTHMTFTATTYSRNYNGKDESGSVSYFAGPTKVWVMMQGLQATSYGIDSPTTIVAQDYPPCTYSRD